MQPDDKTSLQESVPRPRIERELRLLTTITQEIAAAGDFLSSVRIALARIGGSTGWVFGELWVPNIASSNSVQLEITDTGMGFLWMWMPLSHS